MCVMSIDYLRKSVTPDEVFARQADPHALFPSSSTHEVCTLDVDIASLRIGVLPFAHGATFADLEQSWLAAEGASFATLWTVDHATPTRGLRPAR